MLTILFLSMLSQRAKIRRAVYDSAIVGIPVILAIHSVMLLKIAMMAGHGYFVRDRRLVQQVGVHLLWMGIIGLLWQPMPFMTWLMQVVTILIIGAAKLLIIFLAIGLIIQLLAGALIFLLGKDKIASLNEETTQPVPS